MSPSDWLEGLDAPDARRWEFEQDGDQLVGEVVATGTFTGDYGTSNTVTIMPDVENTTEDGSKVQPGEALIFYASSKIAADEFEAKRPAVGDLLAIRYKGERSTKDGKNSYKVFAFAIQKAVLANLDKAAEGSDAKADW